MITVKFEVISSGTNTKNVLAIGPPGANISMGCVCVWRVHGYTYILFSPHKEMIYIYPFENWVSLLPPCFEHLLILGQRYVIFFIAMQYSMYGFNIICLSNFLLKTWVVFKVLGLETT